MKSTKYRLAGLLALAIGLGAEGCRWSSGPGDTVETPPRALVEKTFRPQGGPPGPTGSATSNPDSTPAPPK